MLTETCAFRCVQPRVDVRRIVCIQRSGSYQCRQLICWSIVFSHTSGRKATF